MKHSSRRGRVRRFARGLTPVCLWFLALGGALAQPNFPLAAKTDDTAFEAIFDGQSLDGWQGEINYGCVDNGCLVEEVTPDTLLKQNSFIIWRGGTATAFDLKIEFCNFQLKRLPAHGGQGAIEI